MELMTGGKIQGVNWRHPELPAPGVVPNQPNDLLTKQFVCDDTPQTRDPQIPTQTAP